LETERVKLRKVLLRWSIDLDDVLLNDAEIDGLMDRCDDIARELKTLVGPRKRQEAPMESPNVNGLEVSG
jgi:hypothetical protein